MKKRSVVILSCLAAVAGLACRGGSSEEVGTLRQEVVGNIQPASVQIDGPTAGADLFADAGAALNAGATVDWVMDLGANGPADAGCLGSDGIATCVEPGVTGAPGGTGHWTGVRVVDGIGGADQDIFVKGGKENDADTWLISPGSVGSSKFDMVQAYLANNQQQLFFGMERAGTNGTTAFDFEFNQVAPMARPDCAQNPLIPCRSVGDILFTFELQGSGGSGSATPFVFRWDGAAFGPLTATGVYSSINTATSTPGGPWGHVNSRGEWVLGSLDRFQFAEALAPLSLLPGVNACGGEAWVQVRTRSSSVDTSDLKDTSKAFRFVFNNVAATAVLSPSCDQGFTFSASAKDADGRAVTDGTCQWTFSDGTTSTACSGFHPAAPGRYTATVKVTAPSLLGCEATDVSDAVTVYAPLGVDAAMTADCNLAFAYEALASGGSGAANQSWAWAFSGGGAVSPPTSTLASGTATVSVGGVPYTGVVTVTDVRDGLSCTASDTATATPLAPLDVSLSLRAAAPLCPSMTDDAVTWDAVPSGGTGAYVLEWTPAACSGSSCSIDPAATVYCAQADVQVMLKDLSGLCPAATSELEHYSKVTTVTATDAP